ncbi:MAG: hypothetical protein ABDH91_06505 [Bacteroidia bacterium]
MGGALAALGLLKGCRGEEDARYFPKPLGVYLQLDSSLWWVSHTGAVQRLPWRVRALQGLEAYLLALSAQGDSLLAFPAGSTTPRWTLRLPYRMKGLAASLEPPRFYLVGESWAGIGGVFPLEGPRVWKWYRLSGPATHVAVAPAFGLMAGPGYATAFRLEDMAPYAHLALPGQPEYLWIEHPGGASGVCRQDSLYYAFSYQHAARTGSVQAVGGDFPLERLTSPYLKAYFGQEYTGAVTRSRTGHLTPGGYTAVESIGADFFGGMVYFLRRDSIWRFPTSAPNRLELVTIQPQAQRLAVVPVYTYGSAEVTMR